MKKIALAILLSAATFQAQAGDACATVLCLGGTMMGGQGGDMCSSGIDDYFDIKKYRKGKFSPSKTAKARKEYLDECKSEDNKLNKARINAKFGTVRNNPF